MARLVREMPQAERTVLARSQLVLVREKEISQLFVDGLVGRAFARPLAFYLARRKEYLRSMARLCTPGRKLDLNKIESRAKHSVCVPSARNTS